MPDKTVAEKLLIKPGDKVWLISPPDDYLAILGLLPDGVVLLDSPEEPVDLIQFFVATRSDIENKIALVKSRLKPSGLLWISYHKGTSKVKTDINRDSLRAYVSQFGLEGVSLISIDDDWSAMRFKVIG